MHLIPIDQDGACTGDFIALLRQLDAPNDITIANGYATLMARMASPEYRRRCGLISH